MLISRWAVVSLGVLLLAGCATTVEGQAEPASIAHTASSAASASADSESAPPPSDADSATQSAANSSPQTRTSGSASPVPPVDPEPDATEPDATEPGAPITAPAPGADPLFAPPFLGSTMVDPASFRGVVTDVGFQSPSGNIACGFFDADGVVCQIAEFDYAIPPKPEECGDTGWGFNFGVEATGGGFLFCAGDVEGGGPTLAYGQQLAVDDYHCVSREDGVTCLNAAVGGGFAISRAAFQLF